MTFAEAIAALADYRDLGYALAEVVYRGKLIYAPRIETSYIQAFMTPSQHGLPITPYQLLGDWIRQHSPQEFQRELWNRGYLEQAMAMRPILDWLEQHT
jgi:hypothetical protein